MVKMSILPWRHKWLLVRIFKHKNTIPVLHSIRTACLPCRSQTKQWGWAGTEHSHVPLSQHEPRGRKCDSELDFPHLLTPGCRESWLPPCLGRGWGQGTPPWFLSLSWVLCRSEISWTHLSDSYPRCRPRMQEAPVMALQKKRQIYCLLDLCCIRRQPYILKIKW